ncbi:MAG: hypothetical protein IJM45_08095 [Clostridia bacterium]|nr:hypothetical protein [Clostridia bacterium]
MERRDWEKLSYAEKNRQLFFEQKELLDTFLEHHAITREQYDKSYGDLKMKMGINEDDS